MGGNKACVGASRRFKRASVGNIVPSGGSFRVDGYWAAPILSSTFPSDRDRDFFNNKAWENEVIASEGYRLFTTNVQSYGCFGESFILVGAS